MLSKTTNFIMPCSSNPLGGWVCKLFTCMHTEKPRALSHDKQQLKSGIYGVMLANSNKLTEKNCLPTVLQWWKGTKYI